MATNITDVNQFDSTIQWPSDGETASATDTRTKAIQRLSNRTYYNKLKHEANLASIGTNTANIAANAATISGHTSDIAANLADISNNTSAIVTLGQYAHISLTGTSSGSPFTASIVSDSGGFSISSGVITLPGTTDWLWAVSAHFYGTSAGTSSSQECGVDLIFDGTPTLISKGWRGTSSTSATISLPFGTYISDGLVSVAMARTAATSDLTCAPGSYISIRRIS